MQSSLNAWRERKRAAKQTQTESVFPNTILGSVRDNGEMTLSPGERISHDDYGVGEVIRVTGEGTKSIALVRFETAGDKKLLIKIAPITKL
jgi:DNA helicase-2/ATP-dependent DNA helicase PcrA